MRKEYDAVDFIWWNLWEEISPGAPERLDILAGQVCAYIHNANAGKQSEMINISDAVLKFEPQKETVPETSVKDLRNKFHMLVSAAKKGGRK